MDTALNAPADLRGWQIEAGLKCVEKSALAHARDACQGRDLPATQLKHSSAPRAVQRGKSYAGIPRGAVDRLALRQFVVLGIVQQIDFVEQDCGTQALAFGQYEKPIHGIAIDCRFTKADQEQNLVDVGDGGPVEAVAAGKDLGDYRVARGVLLRLEVHLIAHAGLVVAMLFENTAQGCFEGCPAGIGDPDTLVLGDDSACDAHDFGTDPRADGLRR